jgi:predicted dehydrogenase
MGQLRVGILGTAQIAKKNARAIHASQHAMLVAVGSRDAQRAAQWAAEHCAFAGPLATGTYEDLLANADVDAVYVPLPTTMHAEWVPKVAQAGKHILLEKPVGVDAADFAAQLSACRAAGIQLMDGTMFMHHERLQQLLKLFDPNEPNNLGRPRRVTSAFSFPGDADFFSTNIRIKKDADPLGCVGDLGWYNVRLALAVFGWELPTSVHAVQAKATDDGVPVDVTADVYFGADKARILSLHCSFRHTLRQWAEIETTGEKLVRVEDFVLPTIEDGAKYTVISGSLAPVPIVEHKCGPCCQEVRTAVPGPNTLPPARSYDYRILLLPTYVPRSMRRLSCGTRLLRCVMARATRAFGAKRR